MITKTFIYAIFTIAIIFDIWLVVKYGRGETITAKFRDWFKTLIIVPYAIGVLFIGHFLNII